jgi:hypothetical protein
MVNGINCVFKIELLPQVPTTDRLEIAVAELRKCSTGEDHKETLFKHACMHAMNAFRRRL